MDEKRSSALRGVKQRFSMVKERGSRVLHKALNRVVAMKQRRPRTKIRECNRTDGVRQTTMSQCSENRGPHYNCVVKVFYN